MHFAWHDGAERSMRQSSNGGTLWRGGGFVQCSSHRLFRKEQRGLVVHLSDKERFYINRSDEDGRRSHRRMYDVRVGKRARVRVERSGVKFKVN